MTDDAPPRRSGSLPLEAGLALVAVAVWVAVVVHRRSAGVAGVEIEFWVFGPLLAPLHAARLLALRGLVPRPPRGLFAPWLLALLAFGLRRVDLALTCAALTCLPLAAPPGDPEHPADAPLARALTALAAAALLGATAALALGIAWLRPGALGRAALFLPVLLEAIANRRTRDPRAQLRRVAAATAVAAFAVCRHEVLLGLLVGGVTASLALVALRVARRPVEERARAWRRAGFGLTAAALGLGLPCLVGEVALRLRGESSALAPARRSDEAWHVPGRTYTFRGAPGRPLREPNVVTWNNHGWWDVDRAFAKPPGTTRVLVLGDSFVEGIQVELEALYHRQLERALRARGGAEPEVIALGWSGWGQADELAWLRKEGLRYDPDLIVVEFLAVNDVSDNLPALKRARDDHTAGATFARPIFADALNKGLRFLALAARKTDQALLALLDRGEPLDADVYAPEPTRHAALWAQAWERTEALFAELQQVARARDVPLVVVVFTSAQEVEAERGAEPPPGLDLGYPARRVLALCERLKIPAVDLNPRFAQVEDDAQRVGLHLVGDGHWSAAGHRRAAEETARFLCDETDLWRRVSR